jgi:hypothetical protein
MDKFIPLFFLHAPATKANEGHRSEKTKRSGIQSAADQQPQSERYQCAAAQLILPAHKNTPCQLYAEGV